MDHISPNLPVHSVLGQSRKLQRFAARMADRRLTFSVRLGHPSDAPGICALHKRAIRLLCSTHYSPMQVEQWQERQTDQRYKDVMQRGELFIAESSGSTTGLLLGFASVRVEKNRAGDQSGEARSKSRTSCRDNTSAGSRKAPKDARASSSQVEQGQGGDETAVTDDLPCRCGHSTTAKQQADRGSPCACLSLQRSHEDTPPACDHVAGRISAVYVDPDFACQGVGRSLLRAAEDEIGRQAALHCSREHHVTIEVEASLNARGFYARCGYLFLREAVVLPKVGHLPLQCCEMSKQMTVHSSR